MTEYGPTNSASQQHPPPLDTNFHQGRTGKSSHALSSPTRLDPFHSLCASSGLRSPTKNSRPFFRPTGQQTQVHTSECHPPPPPRRCWRGPQLHTYSLAEYPYQLESSPRVLFTVWFRSLGLMWHMLCTVYICAVQNSDIPDFTLIGFIQGGRARPQILGLDHSSMSPLPSPSTSYPQMNAHTPLVQLPIHYRKQHKYFPQDAHRHHSLPMLAVPGMIPQHIGEEFVQQRH